MANRPNNFPCMAIKQPCHSYKQEGKWTWMYPVITISHHDLKGHKKLNGVATDLFCTGVIGHPGHMFLN